MFAPKDATVFICCSLGPNRNRLAIVVCEIFKKSYRGVAEISIFFSFLYSSFLVNSHLELI